MKRPPCGSSISSWIWVVWFFCKIQATRRMKFHGELVTGLLKFKSSWELMSNKILVPISGRLLKSSKLLKLFQYCNNIAWQRFFVERGQETWWWFLCSFNLVDESIQLSPNNQHKEKVGRYTGDLPFKWKLEEQKSCNLSNYMGHWCSVMKKY